MGVEFNADALSAQRFGGQEGRAAAGKGIENHAAVGVESSVSR